ncbi:ABC transporter permease [Desulfobotulus mexicanus]|uniref:ABC transporter permease n=1 Tax=Desulfobotulus mexicanus TaxID=2586642 RepID=A0A5Q4VDW5_9BACT|nr:ABC transporter permease [Desulfobotulus mexicanus]TYT75116.1 ABC transporter permease [Desulfobotulus mexicanus]
MNWRHVWILFVREARPALRDKTIVVNAILLPLLLYPFILWVVLTGMAFVQGQTEGLVSRIVIEGLPAEHSELNKMLEKEKSISLQPLDTDLEMLQGRIRQGDLDLLMVFEPETAAKAAVQGNFTLTLFYNASLERSNEARKRLAALVENYRENWLEKEALGLGIDPVSWRVFEIKGQNEASIEKVGAFFLGLLLPIFFVIMVALGSYYPAVDATAGERERGTWETTMSLATSRSAIVIAKYLYVVAFGFMAGMINLIAMTVFMGRVFLSMLGLEDLDVKIAVPWSTVPLLLLGGLLLAGFVAAGMMLFAVFARNFKEGQAMVTPFLLLLSVPMMFFNLPGLEFSNGMALVPVVNVAMMVQDAINGNFSLLPVFLTCLSSGSLIAICIGLASLILRVEDVVHGSYRGSLWGFLRQRFFKKV